MMRKKYIIISHRYEKSEGGNGEGTENETVRLVVVRETRKKAEFRQQSIKRR
jgi:hypothetical protein